MTPSETSSDKRLEILYAHYCAIVERNKTDVRTRYRYLFYTLVVLVFNLLQMLYASDASVIVNGLLSRLFNTDENRNYLSIDFMATLVLMLLVVRYLQIAISIERQYPYIHSLEHQLSEQFVGDVFSFEGEGYLNNYPKSLDGSHLIYTVVVPAIIVIVALWRISIETPLPLTPDNVARFATILFSFVIIVFVLLYWQFLYQSNNKDRCREDNESGQTTNGK